MDLPTPTDPTLVLLLYGLPCRGKIGSRQRSESNIMSLNCVTMSGAKKTAGCAVTYRSGDQNMFGTCPDTCKLKPSGQCGSPKLDRVYWKAIRNAKPRRGASFTYSHFSPSQWPDTNRDGVTTVNYSADTPRAAALHTASGTASVTVVPQT